MSKTRKNIQNTLFDEAPEISETQSIVRVVSTRGTNQIEVEYPVTKERILVILPTKFNKLVWVKKGDYVVISTDRSEQNKGKIKGFVDHILLSHHVKSLKKQGQWPLEFETNDEEDSAVEKHEKQEDEYFEGNPNRVAFSDDEEDEEDDDEEDNN
ncbi:hypothetical protein FDP41_012886 [Naegleria fowleri]|uniref:S1-like domain-containing protein n=1 Tax=Naegleria fowleri TaxID=5763 RepID=A0A6A5C5I2_NAEFO|nr:uncharacterized protein FDP41_012886 [Naegleria fowleri]KAF0981098.1 hypothetical protein FDP41_012886 [Naegleria fowleri]CAG4711723.1 unnamed protein product [Naegleria fowleri]